MKKYMIIKSDLYINGKVYPEGSIIELDDDNAKHLILYLQELTEPESEKSIDIKKNKRSK
jgi:hypothetical protein